MATNFEEAKKISDKINSQKLLGYSGKRIKNVINIGIGGSDLGPKMACEALKYYSNRKIHLFFISNIDPTNLKETLRDLNAKESIFIISSKSFETIETLTNATIAKKWFLDLQNIICNTIEEIEKDYGSNIKFKEVSLDDAEKLFKFYNLETKNLINQIS